MKPGASAAASKPAEARGGYIILEGMSGLRKLIFLFLFAWMAAPGPASAASGQPRNSRPSLVLFTIDTLRADHLGCYGYRNIRTPNIDALAREGARFERAFTTVPVTLPSHAALLTGTYPMYNGMHDFSGNKLNASQPTLASILKENGYATGAVLGSAVLDSRFGLNSGFDFYYDHFEFNRLSEANLDEMERPGNQVVDEALRWLDQNRTRPFFLWVHLYDPHAPYTPPPPYDAQYKEHPYDGEIAFADAQTGRVLQYLKDHKLYRNTMVVLAGDHGEGLGEHGEKTHGFFLYHSTLHVPLIVKLPGAPAKGRVVAARVSLVDVLPTILAELRLEAPKSVQGRSLAALVEGKRDPAASDIYAETFLPRLHFNWSELRSVEIGKYHYIEAPRPELYDPAADPRELNDLAGAKKALTTEYGGQLNAVVRKYSTDKELAEATGLDPAMAERLKSLGYAAVSGGSQPAKDGGKLADPKDRIVAYELIADAIADSQHGRYAPSIEKLQAALNIHPDSVPVRYLLGLNYYRVGDYESSIQQLSRVLGLSPDYALAVYQLGLAQGKAGRTDEAIRSLARALELDPTNFAAAFNMGSAYLQQNKVDEAVASFRQAIAINPGHAPAHQALGRVLLYQGKNDEALAELLEAARLEPRDPLTHRELARAYDALGQPQQAQEEMEKARRLEHP